MQSGAGEPGVSWDLRHSHFQRATTDRPDPAVAVIQRIAEAFMEIAGPLFWAALVVGFVTDLLGVGFLR
jgi:hypothetical protein